MAHGFLFIGFIAAISLVIGISLGAIAGYFGGRVDAFIMWIINITWSIPTLLLQLPLPWLWEKGTGKSLLRGFNDVVEVARWFVDK